MDDHEQIRIDPSDPKGLEALMDKYGDSRCMTIGSNEIGEDVTISIFRDKIITETYQANGWIRQNVYHRDRSREELFTGRWEDPDMDRPQVGLEPG